MRNNPFLLLILPLALTGCGEDRIGVEPFDTGEPGLRFPVGQRRAIHRSFTHSGAGLDIRVAEVGVYEVVKDTVVDGLAGKVVSGTVYSYYRDTAETFTSRRVLAQDGNRIYEYQFKEELDGFMATLLKAAAYDTARFSDKVTQLQYPLIPEGLWMYRPEDAPLGSPMGKKYLGLDTVEFDGRDYACGKFLIPGPNLTTWVSRLGLLKAETGFDPYTESDSTGTVTDTSRTQETYRLLKIDPTDGEIEAFKQAYAQSVR